MAEVVLFHHAQGLTPGVIAFADALRDAGHIVHTPDLFEGRTFDSIQAGMSFVREIGFGEVMARGAHAAADLPAELIYVGFSLGVVPAQMLAQTRSGAQGAILCYACVPVSEFGAAWPECVPVQIHGMDADPFFVDEGDIDAARALVAEAEDAELFLYPGDQHYFADSSLPSYDAEASALLTQRVLDFLTAKETQMAQQPQSTLDVIYENWRGYQEKLRTAIAPLTVEQLLLQPAPHMWPLGQIVQHIISVRAGWFSGTLQDEDDGMTEYMDWGQRDSAPLRGAELARGLDETWAFIETRLQRWTPDDCAQTFPDEWDGQVYELSRSWVIYHVMEHDLHHGGEVSLILGMNGLPSLNL